MKFARGVSYSKFWQTLLLCTQAPETMKQADWKKISSQVAFKAFPVFSNIRFSVKI